METHSIIQVNTPASFGNGQGTGKEQSTQSPVDIIVRSHRRGRFPAVCAYSCAHSAPRLWRQWKRPPVPLYHRFHVSWAQCVGAIVIYGLLLTDVIRTGLGVADVSSLYWVLEPDGLFALSGPWITAIGTFAAPHKTAPSSPQTDNQTLKLWPYKFDTTSIGMRAFARFLNLTAWPQCVFQRQVQCVGVDFNSLSKDTVFHMLDALVDGVRARKLHRSVQQHAPVVGATTATTLRVQSTWYDRVHDFILPPLFASKLTHTTQALYFNSSARIGSGLCSHAVSIRPYHCASFLGNVKHLSTMDGALNDRLVSQVIVDRVDAMQTQFPATQLDFVVIETKSDAFMGSLSFQGRRTVSIVLITRLRSCTSIDNCATAFIDDYRFDDVLGSSNVAQWYRIVSTLRVIGQSYVWVRLFALVLAFHQSTCADPLLTKHSRFARWKLTAKALLVIPSHVIVYSSVLPIACYTIAHAIDSSMTYEMLNQKFTTADGVLNVNLLEFFYWSSIQMRNIWLLALALHALSYLRAQQCWSPSIGSWGIAEFVVSGTSMLTIFAQFRGLTLRDSTIVSVHETPHSPKLQAIKFFCGSAYSFTKAFTSGNALDGKCLCASLILVCSTACVMRLIMRYFCCWDLYQSTGAYLKVWTKTWVSQSAGQLWPAHNLIVTWHDMNTVTSMCNLPSTCYQRKERQLRRRSALRAIVPAPPSLVNINAASLTCDKTFLNDPLDSLVYLSNLVMMTDPITFCRLRIFGNGVPLCLLQCKQTSCTMLIARALVESPHDVDIDWENWVLLAKTDSTKVPWSELLHCGTVCQPNSE